MTLETDQARLTTYSKPSFWRQPRAWLIRKIKLKLADFISPLGLRVVERVDFSSLQISGPVAQVLDVGAADGTPDLYSRLPDAQLELFEPQEVHHAGLKEKVLNQRRGRLHPFALGAENGTAYLSLTGRTGASFATKTRLDGSIAETAPVPVRRLDEVLNVSDILRPCLLKIDTEGFEMDVLRGAEGLLADIDIVVVEVHFDKPHMYRPFEIVEFLAGYGFKLTDMLDYHVRRNRMVCADLVFESGAG